MRTGALGGLSFIRRLHFNDQQTPILVLTMHSDAVIVSRAVEGRNRLSAQRHLLG